MLGRVDLRGALQPSGEQADLRRRRPLLRGEHLGGVDEAGGDVAGHEQLDAAQPLRGVDRPHRPEAAVGGGRSAEADDDLARSGVEGEVDQLAGAGGRRGHRVVALGPADEGEAGGRGHLDDRGVPRQPPAGLHRITERTGDGGRAVGAAEHVEGPLAAVGHRDLDAVVTEVPAGVAHRGAGPLGGEGAAELVERRNHLHPAEPTSARRRSGSVGPLRPCVRDAANSGVATVDGDGGTGPTRVGEAAIGRPDRRAGVGRVGLLQDRARHARAHPDPPGGWTSARASSTGCCRAWCTSTSSSRTSTPPSTALGQGLAFLTEVFVRQRHFDLVESELRHLSTAAGGSAGLAARDGTDTLLMAYSPFAEPGQLDDRPRRVPLHLSAMGKVLLAYADPDDGGGPEALVPLAAPTSRSIRTLDALRAQLDVVRAEGFAVANRETWADQLSVAVPIFEPPRLHLPRPRAALRVDPRRAQQGPPGRGDAARVPAADHRDRGGLTPDRCPVARNSISSCCSSSCSRRRPAHPPRIRDDLHHPAAQPAQPVDDPAREHEHQQDHDEAEDDPVGRPAPRPEQVPQRCGDLLEAGRHPALVERPLRHVVRHRTGRTTRRPAPRSPSRSPPTTRPTTRKIASRHPNCTSDAKRSDDHQHRPGDPAVHRADPERQRPVRPHLDTHRHRARFVVAHGAQRPPRPAVHTGCGRARTARRRARRAPCRSTAARRGGRCRRTAATTAP